MTSESMLLLDGNNLRYHHEDSQYVVEFDRYCKEITEHLYTAEDYRELFPEGLGSGTWPQARVRRSGAYKGAGLTDIRPMLMAFRAHAGPLVSIQLSEYAVTGNSIVIAGATCYELMSGGAGQPAHSRLYIDPGKGHSVARQITYMNGKPYEQVTISHRYYPRIGWAPMSWDFVRYYGEKFSQSGKAEVTGLHAPASVDVEEFSLPFPPGSRVSDERTPEEYLIRHDGSKRRVLSSDIGATYEQMMATEPGAALPPTEPPAPRFPWVVAAAVLSGCLCLSLFIYRRMRSRTS